MTTYTIKYGDTLGAIAKQNGTTVDALLKANPTIKDPNRIYSGSSLNLATEPAAAPTPQPTPTTPAPKTGATIAEKASLIPDMPAEDKSVTDYYSNLQKNIGGTQDEAEIRRNIRRSLNEQFNALRVASAQKIAEERRQGEGRLGSARAIQARSGTLGSNFAGAENDQVNRDTQDMVNSINAETEAKIAFLMGESEKDYSAQIKAARDAKKAGADEYIKYINERDSIKQTKATNLAKLFAAQGIDPETMTADDVAKLQKTYGLDAATFKTLISDEKAKIETEKAKAAAEALKNNSFNLSEGQARYVYDPITGETKLVASKAKTYAPKSGGGTSTGGYGVGTDGKKIPISPQAQIYVDAVNNGANLDDILKGTSIATQALRGEVIAGLNLQGGQSKKSVDIIAEGKKIVDDMITTGADKALGGYSTRFGGQFSTAYGDAKAKANQLSAILARDNLGLLKGAMSDKDLAFIQSMSSGFDGEGVQSEDYIKSRLETIQEKLATKINASGFQNSYVPQENVRSQVEAQGLDYDAMVADGLTDEEILNSL